MPQAKPATRVCLYINMYMWTLKHTTLAVYVITALFAFALPASAQKEFREIKQLVKDKKANDIISRVEKYAKDSVLSKEPRLYDYGKQAQIMINDAENEKIYLKQSYDTAKFFSSNLEIVNYILKCEDAEQKALALNGDKPKFHKENSKLVHLYHSNLGAAGRYYYYKHKYKEALPYLEKYLTVPAQTIWGNDKKIEGSRDYEINAYLFQKAAFLSENYKATLQFNSITLKKDFPKREVSFEYSAAAAANLKDTSLYVSLLYQGLEDYPTNHFFFTHLTDYYANEGSYETGLALANKMLESDSSNLIYLEAKGLLLLNLNRNEEAIEICKKCLLADTSHVELNYYIGIAYNNLASQISLPGNINSHAYKSAAAKQKSLYSKALPYLELYRKKAPDKSSLWAPQLYKVYLNLNMGKQFDDIDSILKSLPKQSK